MPPTILGILRQLFRSKWLKVPPDLTPNQVDETAQKIVVAAVMAKKINQNKNFIKI